MSREEGFELGVTRRVFKGNDENNDMEACIKGGVSGAALELTPGKVPASMGIDWSWVKETNTGNGLGNKVKGGKVILEDCTKVEIPRRMICMLIIGWPASRLWLGFVDARL